jgi:hypothetical protein
MLSILGKLLAPHLLRILAWAAIFTVVLAAIFGAKRTIEKGAVAVEQAKANRENLKHVKEAVEARDRARIYADERQRLRDKFYPDAGG